MQAAKAVDLTALSDNDLISKLEALGVRENETTVELLFHLAAVDDRKAYLALGYNSLFTYCTKGPLRYAESAALRRIYSARTLAKFPALLELLLKKELSITTLSLVAKLLTPTNFVEVVNAVKGKSRREVEEFIARLQSKPIIAEKIKPVAISKNISKAIEVNNQSLDLFNVLVRENASSPQSADNLSVNQAQQGDLQQESANGTAARDGNSKELRYELRFSVSSEVLDEIEEAKVILSGKFPGDVR